MISLVSIFSKWYFINLKLMKKSAQANRSALLMAGQKSLHTIEQQTRNFYTNNSRKDRQQANQILYESTVHQVYKRPTFQVESQNTYSNNESKYIKRPQYNMGKYHIESNQPRYQAANRFQEEFENLKNKPTQSLQIQTYNPNTKPITESLSKSPKRNYSYELQKIDNERIKKIMMKLTFTRLRKIQALVKGFLVRRKLYPKLLQEYLIAKSVLSLIQANVIYREISTIIMETITFPKYDDQQQFAQLYKGRQKILQDMIYDTILTRVIQKEMKPVIEESLIKRALLVNRPQITFGFNLRDPLELLLYERLLQIMSFQLRNVCEESIGDEAMERRELFIIDQWIQKYNLLKPLYKQIANQILQQNIGEYIVDDILQKVTKQAAFVVAESVYNNQVNDWYLKTIQNLKSHVQEAVLQEAFGYALIQMGFGIQKLHQKESLL